MAETKEEFALHPEAKEIIDQIVEGLRRYLTLLMKDRTAHQDRQANGGYMEN